MSVERIYLKEGFFKFLVSLEELNEKKDKVIFINSIGVCEEIFYEFVEFLKQFDISVFQDENFIYPLKEKNKIHFELNLSEWFALQATLDTNKEATAYYTKLIQNKIEEVQLAYARFCLIRKDNQGVKKENYTNLKKVIEFGITQNKLLLVSFYKSKSGEIYPHRLVYIDGVLCVIGEDVHDKTLSYFGVEDIQSINFQENTYAPNLSQIEINEFINHIRLINGNEERLILKIYSTSEDDELSPSNHYLGNPFVTSNGEGDMIWAASIEMCEDVFKWLYQMKDKVEILDPGHIRKEFSHYCELKKENQKEKKVS